jgi:hypothetical protein
MKKTVLLAVLALALGGARLEAGIEVAGNGTRLESNNDIAGNIERSIVRFTATYDGEIGGRWNCVGFRISNSSLTSDTEQCIFTDLSTFPPGTYSGHPYFYVNDDGQQYHWNSDYDGLFAHHVRVTITDNGDGTGHADVEAYY